MQNKRDKIIFNQDFDKFYYERGKRFFDDLSINKIKELLKENVIEDFVDYPSDYKFHLSKLFILLNEIQEQYNYDIKFKGRVLEKDSSMFLTGIIMYGTNFSKEFIDNCIKEFKHCGIREYANRLEITWSIG
jgi:hypothetical protein